MLMICVLAYKIVSEYENTLMLIVICEVPVQIYMFMQQHDQLQVRNNLFLYWLNVR